MTQQVDDMLDPLGVFRLMDGYPVTLLRDGDAFVRYSAVHAGVAFSVNADELCFSPLPDGIQFEPFAVPLGLFSSFRRLFFLPDLDVLIGSALALDRRDLVRAALGR